MNKWIRRIEPAAFYFVLIYAALLLFSINYLNILSGLDPSWAYALNHFAHGPEIFGRDLVLNYGPLAYLAVPQHVGSNIAIAAFVHVIVWTLLIYLLVALRDSGRQFGALVFTLALICSNRLYLDYWDYLICALILLAFLLLFRKPDSPFVLLLLTSLIGGIFLVKFTGYIMAMMLLTAYAVGRHLPKQHAGNRERIFLLLAFASGPIAYLLYNPSLSDLITYTRGSVSMSSGHSTTMSIATESAAAWHAGILSLVLSASTAFCLWKKWVSTAGAAMVIITMWVVFKHGFVRSEPGHQAMFYCFVVLTFAFLLAQMTYTIPKAAFFFTLFSVFTVSALQGASHRWPVWGRYWWSPDANLAGAAQLLDSKQLFAVLDGVSSNDFRDSPIRAYLPTINGSRVLIFPWDIAYASIGHFTTVPLFATQAYLAYTRFLDQESAQKIESASPPIDYVVFEWKAIDSRHPLLDVPAIWNVLFTHFSPAMLEPDSLLLKRRNLALNTSFRSFEKASCPAEQWIGVPNRNTPVALSLNLEPSLAGSLLSILYQVAPITLEMKTRSGNAVSWHIPPSVVASPFPLNYLPLDPPSLNALWTDNVVSDPVTSFRLTGPGLSYIPCRGLQFYDVTGTAIHILPAHS